MHLTAKTIEARYALVDNETVATVDDGDAVLIVGVTVSLPIGVDKDVDGPGITLIARGPGGEYGMPDWAGKRERYAVARDALTFTVRAARGSREALPHRYQRMLTLGWDAWQAEAAQGKADAHLTVAASTEESTPAEEPDKVAS